LRFKKSHKPWNKGKVGVYSKKTLEKISKAKKGRKLSEEHKKRLSESHKGQTSWMKGKKHSQESRKNISEKIRQAYASGLKPWNKGKKGIYSEKTRKKMSLAQKGRVAWNKGKKGIYSEETRRKMSRGRKGRDPWNKGKKGIYSEETLREMSRSRKGRKASEETKKKQSIALKGLKRKPFSKEHLKKLSVAHTGKKASEETKKKMSIVGTGRKTSEETKKKMSITQKRKMRSIKLSQPKEWEEWKNKIREKRRHQVFPVKDTKPERDMQKLLKSVGIEFKKHKPILGQPDAFIQPNICIFTDGDYWHANPKPFISGVKKYPGFKPNEHIIGKKFAKDAWAYDKRITDTLKKDGYVVLRFWESELETDPEKCIQKIKKIIKQTTS